MIDLKHSVAPLQLQTSPCASVLTSQHACSPALASEQLGHLHLAIIKISGRARRLVLLLRGVSNSSFTVAPPSGAVVGAGHELVSRSPFAERHFTLGNHRTTSKVWRHNPCWPQ